jgi:hypothetical protein
VAASTIPKQFTKSRCHHLHRPWLNPQSSSPLRFCSLRELADISPMRAVAWIFVAISLCLGGCAHSYREPQRQTLHALKTSAAKNARAASQQRPSRLAKRCLTCRKSVRAVSLVRSGVSLNSAPVLSLPEQKHYVVLDTVGHCTIVDSRPSAESGLMLIGKVAGYDSIKSADAALDRFNCGGFVR